MCFLPLCNRGCTLSALTYLQPISMLCVIFSPLSNVGGVRCPPQALPAISHLLRLYIRSGELMRALIFRQITEIILDFLPLIRSVSWHRVLRTHPELVTGIPSRALASSVGNSRLLSIQRGSPCCLLNDWQSGWVFQDKESSRPLQPCGKGICFLGKEVIYLWENTVSTKFA